MFNRTALKWSVLVAACFLLLTGVPAANAKNKGKAESKKANVAAQSEGKKVKEHGKAKAADKNKDAKNELKQTEKDLRKEGDEPKGRGLALGKDKQPGEGLALGKDKAKGPGEGLQLGQAHKGVAAGARAALPGQAALVSAGKKRGPIVAEQRKYRRRLAKLQRLMVVAAEQNNKELLVRVGELRKKEQQRHMKKMAKLRLHGQKGRGMGKAKVHGDPVAQGKKLGQAKGKAGAKKEK